ncbi:hypothetical protein BD769DRAFT_1388227 [Suillus cothurnatus]|nr:hypothetical protein BD769DRAFT_1388227 [Suillus cothurnatus]
MSLMKSSLGVVVMKRGILSFTMMVIQHPIPSLIYQLGCLVTITVIQYPIPRVFRVFVVRVWFIPGYIQLSIRDVVSGGFDIITVEHYFGNCADISEHTVYVSTNDTPTDQVELMVFFDHNLHQNGTQRCSYLVVKKAAGSQAVDLMQSDYVAVVIAIDEILQVVPASETAEAFAKHKATYHF